MPYNKTNWENLPSTNTALNASNLQKIEDELEKLAVTQVTTANTNLNDYKTEGVYYFSGTAVTPTNIPNGVAGWLEVLSSNNNNVKQIWYRASSLNGTAEFNTYVRLYNKSANAWSNWAKYQMVEDSDWLEPTLINGQQPSSRDFVCRYRKINGIVYIKGVITGLTEASQLFTLPAGYRPTGYQRFTTNTGNTVTTSNVVRIAPNGEVVLQKTSNTGTFEITLDGISFVTDN